MAWAVGGTCAFVGLLAVVLGTVTLRTGWVLPTARRHVTRPGLHGLGALFMGTSILLQGLVHLGILAGVSWEARVLGEIGCLFTGLLLIALSHLLPPRRTLEHAYPPGA